MKLLKIENGLGHFLAKEGYYSEIDKITKEDLLRLVDRTLEDDIEFDEYAEKSIHNHAHQIVYKSVFEKLHALKGRKQEFKDESERLYLEDYEKYRKGSSQQNV